jgi:heat shock protein HtpX
MYTQISINRRRTVYMFVVFFALIVAIGWALSYLYDNASILYIAVGIAVIQSWISYFFSDSIALSVSGAKEASRDQFIELHRLVENLAITAGLPKPKVYVINDPSPNAFATGRDPKHSAIAVTTGLLELLEKRELEGVIAHEMAHIGNRDILVMTVAVTLVGAIVLVSDMLTRSWFWSSRDDNDSRSAGIFAIIAIALAILAPLFAQLIQLAVSRKREYLADATGALMTRFPEVWQRRFVKSSSTSGRCAPLTGQQPICLLTNRSVFKRVSRVHGWRRYSLLIRRFLIGLKN